MNTQHTTQKKVMISNFIKRVTSNDRNPTSPRSPHGKENKFKNAKGKIIRKLFVCLFYLKKKNRFEIF